MRTIKFRIWHKDDKEMEPVLEMYWNENGEVWKVETPHSITEVHPEHNILMQFTGLRNKNGKEIYEGDIVEYAGTKSEVSFIKGCFVLPKITATKNDELAWWHEQIEVIGNIYENPELIS